MEDRELIELIRERALLTGTFTLRSGRTSSYYLDKYLFETDPGILRELGQRFADRVDENVDRLAGAELGGIPLVAAAGMASGRPTVLIRNQKKDYGTSKLLEGRLEEGDRVMIVEDVATSGGQVLEAAKVLVEAGAEVIKIVAVIDRQEGARENIEEAGFTFESLLTRDDLGISDD
ncbi:MAG: orotate phosphoribosyltransferase [Phycisphaeraceae bacterium]|nr:orotate phosphoribosyltransferase [Phycisphaeraceae bacterium]